MDENQFKEIEPLVGELVDNSQPRTKSLTWWAGTALVIVQGVVGVMMAAEIITPVVGGSVIAAFAGLWVYFNGNNPSIKGQY